MKHPTLYAVLPPRKWWTIKEYSAFAPLFESRDAALNYYGPNPLMSVVEQTDACTTEQES